MSTKICKNMTDLRVIVDCNFLLNSAIKAARYWIHYRKALSYMIIQKLPHWYYDAL